jgi:hypothetical protein
LFGRNVWKKFAWLQAVTAVIGALLNTGTVWLIAETVNGLMAIPNLIALAVLSPELSRLILDYKQKTGKIAGGGILCKYPSTQTAVSPLPCGNSIPSQLLPKSREKRSTT